MSRDPAQTERGSRSQRERGREKKLNEERRGAGASCIVWIATRRGMRREGHWRFLSVGLRDGERNM